MSILETALKLIRRYPLCDRCLGRLFAQLGRGLDNALRGRALKLAMLMELHDRALKGDERALEDLKALARCMPEAQTLCKHLGIEPPKTVECYICGSKIDEIIAEWSQKAANVLRSEGIKRFLVGVVPPRDFVEREREVATFSGLEYWESIRSELKREIGKRAAALANAKPDFDDPEATIVLNIEENSIHLEIPSLLVLGTYWKLGRRISQVPWIDREGRKKYPLSIEECLQPAARVCCAERAIFHGAGREDVDVRMLGSGRPFVLELYRPRKREIDFIALENAVNSSCEWVKIRLEARVRREVVSKLKAGRGYKIYRALIVCRDEVSEEALRSLEEFFRDRVIEQRTPRRVLRRKSDILRRRKVIEMKTLRVAPAVFEALIKAEGGLYIKELVDGDEGRTSPSISEYLNTPCICVELDVLYVQKQI